MIYRVFDTSINRLYGAFNTEEEALTLVQTLIGSNEDNFADDLAVGWEDADGVISEPLSGNTLLRRIATLLHPHETIAARDREEIALPR
jgi:hypothetical protein